MKICWILVFATILFDQKTDSQFLNANTFTDNQALPAAVVSSSTNNQNSQSFPQTSFNTISQANVQPAAATNVLQSTTNAKPTPRKECCAVAPNLQRECGFPGIGETDCNLRGCCFSPKPENRYWCFQANVEPCFLAQQPTAPQVVATPAPIPTQAAASVGTGNCGILNTARKQCGGNGITQTQCLAQQCCFDSLTLDDRTRCFFSKLNAPRHTEWSRWTSCPTTNCNGKTQTRSRTCIYVDGKQAPKTFCGGKVQQSKNCQCGTTGGTGQSTDKKCEDGSKTCSNFKSLCKSYDSFRNTLCPLTCGTCSQGGGSLAAKPALGATQNPINAKPTARPAPTKPVKTCVDEFDSCSHPDILQDCGKLEHREELRKYCPVSCNLCNEPEPKECKDKYPKTCADRKKTCTEGTAAERQSMQRVCPVTCNSCVKGNQQVASSVYECKDRVDTCYDVVKYCTSIGEVGDAARQNCPFSCQRCPGQTQLTVNTVAVATTTQPILTRLQTPRPQPPARQVVPFEECKDSIDGCVSLKGMCQDQTDSGELMRSSCKATCNLCPPQSGGGTLLQSGGGNFGPPPVQVATLTPPAATFGPAPTAFRPPPTVFIPPATQQTQPQINNQQSNRDRPCIDDLEDGICGKYKHQCSDPATYWPDLCCLTCKNEGIVATTRSPPVTQGSFATRFVQATVAPQTDCEDLIDNCANHLNLCNIVESGWPTSCKKTCGKCGTGQAQKPAPATFRPQTFPTAPKAAPTQKMQISVTGGCQNLLLECEDYKYLCNEPTSTWKDECPVTCNTCGGSGVVSATAQPRPQISFRPPRPALTNPPATQAATPKADCKENEDWCRGKESSCFSSNQETRRIVRGLCRITCGLCVGTNVKVPVTARPVVIATTTTIAPVPAVVGSGVSVQVVQPDVGCKNQYVACAEQIKSCTSDDVDARNTMRRVCPVTCGSCDEFTVVSPVQTKPSTACVDQFTECPEEVAKCTDAQTTVRETMRQYCPVTCNACTNQPQPQPVVPAASINVNQRPAPVVVAPAAPVVSVVASTDSKCEDKEDWCPNQASACNSGDEVTRETVRKFCPYTCNTCQRTGGNAAVSVINVAPPVVQPTAATFPSNPVTPASAGSIWTQWSSCSVTCGTGSQTRGRICKQSGTGCQFKSESRTCNQGACPAAAAVVASSSGGSSSSAGVSTGGECNNLVVGDWCARMKKTLKVFCDNDTLSKNCRQTCGKC